MRRQQEVKVFCIVSHKDDVKIFYGAIIEISVFLCWILIHCHLFAVIFLFTVLHIPSLLSSGQLLQPSQQTSAALMSVYLSLRCIGSKSRRDTCASRLIGCIQQPQDQKQQQQQPPQCWSAGNSGSWLFVNKLLLHLFLLPASSSSSFSSTARGCREYLWCNFSIPTCSPPSQSLSMPTQSRAG